MNQELILKAVKAVMGFNKENYFNGDKPVACASISVASASHNCMIHSGWNGDEYTSIFSIWAKSDEDLENFINKLSELKGE